MFTFISSLVFGLTVATPLESVKALLQPHSASIGFSVRTLTGKELLSVNGLRPMTPASVAKLVSSACSMEELGPEFKFSTSFGSKSAPKNGVLSGGLIIRGTGDPSFVIEDLRQIVEILRVAFQIKEIKGKLLFDVSYFGTESLSIGDGFDGDLGRSFATDLTAFPFNHNSFSLWIVPSDPKPLVNVLPDFALDLKIRNNSVTTGGSGQNLNVDYRFVDKTAVVGGSIGRDAPPKAFYRAIDNPYASFARIFAKVWSESGGQWQNPSYEISKNLVPMTSIYTHESKPVSRLFLDINKLSTNLGAELIALAAVNKKGIRPLTPTGFEKFIESCVKDFGLPTSSIQMSNASGLSRTTKVTASALSDFLSRLRETTFFPEYLSSLSVVGRDGTTRSRLKDRAGRARLKTGSIRNVRSIAGYVYPKSEEPLTFSMIFNDAKIADAQIQSLENQVLELLMEL